MVWESNQIGRQFANSVGLPFFFYIGRVVLFLQSDGALPFSIAPLKNLLSHGVEPQLYAYQSSDAEVSTNLGNSEGYIGRFVDRVFSLIPRFFDIHNGRQSGKRNHFFSFLTK